MLRVLKTTPGVTDAKIDNHQKWFCIQYQADEKSRWVEPTRFCLNGPRAIASGPYEFTGMFPGLAGPEGIDTHISNDVTDAWKERCGIHASMLFE
jgi:hypothetical protein